MTLAGSYANQAIVAVEIAVDSIESIISGGIAAAMQDFNGR
jgi:hypothetical protein